MELFNTSTPQFSPTANSTFFEIGAGNDSSSNPVEASVPYIFWLAFYSHKKIYFVALRFALGVIGVIGNVLIIRTFIKIGLTDTVTIVLFNIAMSDLNYVNSNIAMGVSELCDYAPDEVFWVYKVHPYAVKSIIQDFIMDTFVRFTAYSTTFVAIQRCLCVIKPLHFNGIFTRRRTFIFLALNWFHCLTFNYIGVIWTEIRQEHWTSYNSTWLTIVYIPGWKWNDYVTYSNIVLGFFGGLCQCVVVVCIFVMTRQLKRSVQFRKAATIEGQSRHDPDSCNKTQANGNAGSKEKKVTIQVSLVATIFILTNFHRLIFEVVKHIPSIGDFFSANFEIYSDYIDMNYLLYLLNASVNFFIYYTYNTRFRQMCFKR